MHDGNRCDITELKAAVICTGYLYIMQPISAYFVLSRCNFDDDDGDDEHD